MSGVPDPAGEEEELRRRLSLDRGQEAVLFALARRGEERGRHGDAFLYASEAARRRPFHPAAAALLDALAARAGADPRVEEYRSVFRTANAPSTGVRRRILVVTNLFPPQEFGGYGRKLWEFAAELRRRGHEVRVLTADMPEFTRPGMAGTEDLEPIVDRSLELFGTWREGRAVALGDQARIAAVIRANGERVAAAAARWGSEVCLAGNIDQMTPLFLYQLPARGVPVLHCIGGRSPGYASADRPRSPLYRPGPASAWVDGVLRADGHVFDDTTIVYPGARVDHFYRPFAPAFDRLRIGYAALFVDYKGPQVLMNALTLLHANGIDFHCVFAGEAADPAFLARCRDFAARQGFGDRLEFPGFLDRRGLAALFDRCNTLVFPSLVEEAFGISHVEAMAAGLAVVSSGTGGAREIVRDGVDGLLFRSGDHDDLAVKLANLSAAPTRWAALARAGQARSFDFAVARSVDRIEATFEELLARRDGRAQAK